MKAGDSGHKGGMPWPSFFSLAAPIGPPPIAALRLGAFPTPPRGAARNRSQKQKPASHARNGTEAKNTSQHQTPETEQRPETEGRAWVS